jgi:hypothetical protein
MRQTGANRATSCFAAPGNIEMPAIRNGLIAG